MPVEIYLLIFLWSSIFHWRVYWWGWWFIYVDFYVKSIASTVTDRFTNVFIFQHIWMIFKVSDNRLRMDFGCICFLKEKFATWFVYFMLSSYSTKFFNFQFIFTLQNMKISCILYLLFPSLFHLVRRACFSNVWCQRRRNNWFSRVPLCAECHIKGKVGAKIEMGLLHVWLGWVIMAYLMLSSELSLFWFPQQ